MSMSLGNVFITGVHKGYGAALATACLDRGARVFGISRQLPDGALGSREGFVFRSVDVTRFDTMGDHLGELLKDVPVLDLAILNAGVLGTIQDLRDTSLDALRAVMDTNVWANKIIIDYLMARHTVRQLIAVSSGSAVNGSAGWGAYSISKAALNLLVRVYAHEHPDTHVTAFAPGLVDTDMIYPVLHGDDPPDYEAVRRIRASGDAGRVMSPGTAAEATLDALPKLLETETGAYVDIRNL